MDKNLIIASNIIVPAIAGLFFFIYFIYFIIINHSKARSFIYFIVFLLSFSLFLLGRPLQLLLSPYPAPLVIVNIRMLIFCCISITSITAASNIFSNKLNKKTIAVIYSIGITLGVLYVVFNTLGTVGSYTAFRWGNITAWESDTPMNRAPWYGREVTIAIQVFIGFLLLVSSLVKIVSAKRNQPWLKFFRDKNFLFNSGIFLFALTFSIGSFTKQWWLYYFFSMFSALLFGAGVVLDIRELYNNYEKLIPVIKEDIIQNVAFSHFSKAKLMELLRCLGKDERLDTFIIISMKNRDSENKYKIQTLDRISAVINKQLDFYIGARNYIIIPLDDQKIGIVLNLRNHSESEKIDIFEILEGIQQKITESTGQFTSTGIGRTHQDIEDLRTSYHEALHALEYAGKLEKNSLIHVNNIQNEEDTSVRYPSREKIQLLAAIKLGDYDDSIAALNRFLAEFRKFTEHRPESLKVRLYELVGSLIDTAIIAGGDEKQLNNLLKECFNDINYMNHFGTAEKWLTEIISRVIKFVAKIQKSRSAVIIEKAREYIMENYRNQISYKDVARELFISSSYFLSLFKQEMDCTFVEFVTRCRVERSKELLINTNLSITEISFEIGISNPNYFSSVFKKIMGISAKDFRSRHKLSLSEL